MPALSIGISSEKPFAVRWRVLPVGDVRLRYGGAAEGGGVMAVGMDVTCV